MWHTLLASAAICAVLSGHAVAAPVITDGLTGLWAVPNLPAGQAAPTEFDALAARFAATGDFGSVLAAQETVRLDTARRPASVQLLAAALAAAGRPDSAADTLRSAIPVAGTARPEDVWGWIALALIERQTGELERASTHARTAFTAAPDNAYARNVAGTIAARREAYDEAVSHFAAAVERAPESAPYLANLGAVLVELGQYGMADTALSRALQLSPEDCTALVAAGRMLAANNEQRSAAAAFERCLAAAPGQPVAAVLLVEAQVAAGDLTAAAATVASHRSAFDDPARTLALIALHAGDGVEARAQLAQTGATPARDALDALAMGLSGEVTDGAASAAAVAAAGYAPAWVVHAGLAAAAGTTTDTAMPEGVPAAGLFAALADPDSSDAVARLTESGEAVGGLRFDGATPGDLSAIATGPARAAFTLGLLLTDQGFSHSARAAFGRAAVAAPDAALAHAFHGATSLTVDPGAARRALEQALALSPRLWVANRLLGEILSREGQFADSAALLATAADVAEDNKTLLLLALAAENAGDIEQATHSYERLLARAPESALINNQFAWFLVTRTQSFERARDLAERAVSLQPDSPSMLDTLGWARYRAGDVEGGLAALRRAFEGTGDTNAEIGLRLAQVAVAAGQPGEARAVLQRLDAAFGGRADGEAADTLRQLVDG